jgi:hypothetical protein
VVTSLAARTPRTINDMSQAFTTVIAPLGTARATRVKAWEDGAWVREAALAHARKQQARSLKEAA